MFLNQGMGAYIIHWIDSEYPEADWILDRCSRDSIADSQPVKGVNRVLKSNELMPLMEMLEKGQAC